MPGKKRGREEAEPVKKPKKIKFTNDETKPTSKLAPEEFDFPRGGGSAFTPLEYKKLRSEAFKEADAELVFEVSLVPSAYTTRNSRGDRIHRPRRRQNINGHLARRRFHLPQSGRVLGKTRRKKKTFVWNI